MSAARDRPPLGEFELLVLLAIPQTGEDAYGSTILQELHRRADRTIARGALYVSSIRRSCSASARHAQDGGIGARHSLSRARLRPPGHGSSSHTI
jgi:hypothetical protein